MHAPHVLQSQEMIEEVASEDIRDQFLATGLMSGIEILSLEANVNSATNSFCSFLGNERIDFRPRGVVITLRCAQYARAGNLATPVFIYMLLGFQIRRAELLC